MRLYIPVIMIAIFALYVIYLAFAKKLKSKWMTAICPGIFFIITWTFCYLAFLKYIGCFGT